MLTLPLAPPYLGGLLLALMGVAWRGWPGTAGLAGLHCQADGQLRCLLAAEDTANKPVPGKLLAVTCCHPWLIVLHLHIEDPAEARRIVLLAPDSLADDGAGNGFRRLRIWLRWRAEISAQA